MRVVDSLGQEVGAYAYPQMVSLQVGDELVLTLLDLQARTFLDEAPTFYYAATGCTGTPLMYLDLTRRGSVTAGTLYFPTGNGSMQAFSSYFDGDSCWPFSMTTMLAAVGQAPVGQFVAPFSLGR